MNQLSDRTVTAWARPKLAAWARLWACPRVRTVTCRLNPRLTSALGRCRSNASVIELSPRLFQRDWRIRREVLCHEAAHVAVRQHEAADARPHGRQWRALMVLAGFRPRVQIRLPRSKVPVPMVPRRTALPTRYAHRCPVCQFTRVAGRRMPRWRCPECLSAGLSGAMTIERLPEDVDRA